MYETSLYGIYETLVIVPLHGKREFVDSNPQPIFMSKLTIKTKKDFSKKYKRSFFCF